MPNSSTTVEAEAKLRALIVPFAKTQIGRESMIEDCQDGFGAILGFDRVREIIDQEYERVRRAAEDRIASASAVEASAKPELEADDDGLAEAVRLAGWAVRWNVTARRVEARKGEQWQDCAGLVRHQMMNDCSRVAVIRRSWKPEPWRIPVRLEDRLLAVVAARTSYEGAGTPVYEAVREWGAALTGGRAITLADALGACGVLHRYESAARAPKSVFADAARALSDLGWEYKSIRTKQGPRKRWASPGPRGALPLGSRDRVTDSYNQTTGKVLNIKDIHSK